MEACSSLSCLSPLASTDALLPSFQPDDDANVTSPPSSSAAEQPQRNYPGSIPGNYLGSSQQFVARRSRSPRSDDLYSGPASYAGHSPRPEITPSALQRSSYDEQVPRDSLRDTEAAVEDLSHSQIDWNQSHKVGDGSSCREMVRGNMDLLVVDTSSPNKQSRDSTANRVS